MFYLFTTIFTMILSIVDIFISFKLGSFGILNIIFVLVIILPSLAVTVRRLHDVNKSGWMVLISFIPIIGAIWLFVLTTSDGTIGDNDYGPDPKGRMMGNPNIPITPIIPISNMETNPISNAETIKSMNTDSPVKENSDSQIL